MIDLSTGPINPKNVRFRGMLKDLQGNILKGHGRGHTRHLFLVFRDGPSARQVIGSVIAPRVTTALDQFVVSERRREAVAAGLVPEDGGLFVNFMLSASGYDALNQGVPGSESVERPGDDAFEDGLKNRRRELRDPDTDSWDAGYRHQIHAHLLLADDTQAEVVAAAQDFQDGMGDRASVVAMEEGFGLKNVAKENIEHFGYVDGRSQPLFYEGDVAAERNNQGTDVFNPAAQLSRILVKDPNGVSGNDSFGSYFVFRKLEQNVRGFMEAEIALAEALGVERDLAGAFAVGRFRDGTPVVLAGRPEGGAVINNFDYADDTDARRCPFQAHIRKSNPRGDIERKGGGGFVSELPRRFARRGIPYGGPRAEGDASSDHPTSGRGLLFMCFNRDIENQFEFLQRQWANQKKFVESAFDGVLPKGSRPGIDPVIGQGDPDDAPRRWPKGWGEKRVKIDDVQFSHFVTMKGGEYFFAPCKSFLLSLA